jgi:hypothetical protein
LLSRLSLYLPLLFVVDAAGTTPDGEIVKVRAADLQSCRASGLMLYGPSSGAVICRAAFSFSDTIDP